MVDHFANALIDRVVDKANAMVDHRSCRQVDVDVGGLTVVVDTVVEVAAGIDVVVATVVVDRSSHSRSTQT